MENFKNKLAFSLLFIFLASGFSLQAQEYSFGLKGGINYSIDKLAAEIYDNSSGGTNYIQPGIGFQGGVFFELRFDKFLLRPEVLYTHSTGEFDLPNPLQYTVNKLSVPLLVGYNIWGPFDIFGGIAYQKVLNNKIETYNGPLERLQNPWAGRLGIKYVYNKIEIDLRYAFTLDSNKFQSLSIPDLGNVGIDDGRLNLLMLSVSYKLFDGKNRVRRKRSCYF